MSVRRRTALATPFLLAAGAAAAQSGPLTLEQIRRNGKLRIGCEATYPPFTYRDAGVITGYDVELATTMCRSLGVEAEFIDTQWSGVIPALYAGRFDIIMSSMSYTRARMERVAFTIPYAEAGQALLIRGRDEGRIRTLADMGGRSLGVKLGSPGETLHPRLAERMRADGGQPFSGVRTYDEHPAAYLALMQGTVDGVLNTLPTLAFVVRSQPGRFSIVRGIGADNWAGIALRREDPEVLAWLNERLMAMRADGSLKALQMKWFGLEFNLPDAIPTPAA
ncbi:transporter substrate-binding domain-containing protein [Roseococcus suduntuyensis]|uniref:Polar amino acid transport system substrate-binding protein n=1 Tax=Roseococcus suduntuyensis TaxID=455361 RepID=A0A840AAJ7_9PROT|nr:transporter substrate-binding domain-containing protein [Roseococcus suduntuyensis]MBB3898191.1 polar amino acid transport system substrate-binding protein [Roseococcus suduntuyensis]